MIKLPKKRHIFVYNTKKGRGHNNFSRVTSTLNFLEDSATLKCALANTYCCYCLILPVWWLCRCKRSLQRSLRLWSPMLLAARDIFTMTDMWRWSKKHVTAYTAYQAICTGRRPPGRFQTLFWKPATSAAPIAFGVNAMEAFLSDISK